MISTLDSSTQPIPNGVTAHAEDLARRGIAQANKASAAVREQATRMGEQTVGYIKDEPVKAVLMAAAVGAVTALLVGWATRSRRTIA
jgi:ElaB/YqjD/DUF883 family membrane-anchored ribosome-binding protein